MGFLRIETILTCVCTTDVGPLENQMLVDLGAQFDVFTITEPKSPYIKDKTFKATLNEVSTGLYPPLILFKL